MHVTSIITAHYIDMPGDDPADDWVVIAVRGGPEACFPAADIGDVLDAAHGINPEVDDFTVRGDPFNNMPGENVTVPGFAIRRLITALERFQTSAVMGHRPPVTVQAIPGDTRG